MRLIYQSPLKRKLLWVIMLTSAVSLLFAGAGFVIYDLVTFRQSMVRDLSTLADIIASNAKSSIVFDDAKAAEETLASLRARPEIMSATLYKKGDGFFANYTRPGLELSFPAHPQSSGYNFTSGELVLYYPVVMDKIVGTLYLRSDLQRMSHRFQSYGGIALLVLFCSGLAALFLSTRFQTGISRPILELAETARTVSEKKDFSVRAKKYQDDEIGWLGETFNEMLDQIQNQDAALRHSNEAMVKLNRDLEARVEQRTAALNEANDQMQVFIYTVAHDLRAPLRSMKSFSELLRTDYSFKLDSTGQEYVQRIHRSSQHMDTLIQDLLGYCRLSREELKFESVSLTRVVENVLSFQAADISTAKAKITVEGPLPLVTGHPATLENIITNLISNAIKYVGPNVVPTIKIRGEDRGPNVRLWIEDNGIGVPAEFQDKIFGIFARLHGSERYSGTGIGLAIVRKGLERMSGRCGVESIAGQGSKFWIELPKAT